MARPPSWLPRLHQIRQIVANSVRSHYDRSDIERLFELQPRAAGKLLELLPTVHVGTAHLVERETLAGFLDGVHAADQVTAHLEQVRRQKTALQRRKLRSLVRADLPPLTLRSLPDSITLESGRLEVRFRTVVELAEAMLTLARILEAEGEEFARAYQPWVAELPDSQAEADKVKNMFIELEQWEAERARNDVDSQ